MFNRAIFYFTIPFVRAFLPICTVADMEHYDVIVVGGGLSGVTICHGIQSNYPSIRWKLLEASATLGGRLTNESCQDHNDKIDLGGAWIWQQHQPKITALIKSLNESGQKKLKNNDDDENKQNKEDEINLHLFAQPDDASCSRIDGGAVRLVHRMERDLPTQNIQFNTPITSCKLTKVMADSGSDTAAGIRTAAEENIIVLNGKYSARKVVLAIPPKLIAKHIQFDPALSASKTEALNVAHTWMAAVTKVALVFEKRFWSLQISNSGLRRSAVNAPAIQVYDSTPLSGSIAALTFFTLVTKENKTAFNDDEALAEQVAKQLSHLWKRGGHKEAAAKVLHYARFHVERWPNQVYISEDATPTRVNPHPRPVKALASAEWGDQLFFAASETDLHSPGLMEGAVGAAKRTLRSLQSDVPKQNF